MIRVLIAEDSAVQRELLVALLQGAGDFEVVAAVGDGETAVAEVERLRPDIALLDWHMPGLGGLEATRRIMQRSPTPIVITSASLEDDEEALAFEAIRVGALAVAEKPTLNAAPEEAERLVRTLRLMSEVKVVRRWPAPQPPPPRDAKAIARRRGPRTVAIAGSTGAPGVLASILGTLPADLAAPVFVIQHIANGFLPGFAEWIGGKTALPIIVGEEGMRAKPAHIYLAAEGRQMGIRADRTIALGGSEPEEGFCPSANHLFRSVAAACGPRALGVILSGMGRDGAAGLLAMRQAGGTTAAQDRDSCVIFGMPNEAIRLGAAMHVLSPPHIARLVVSFVSGEEFPHDGAIESSPA